MKNRDFFHGAFIGMAGTLAAVVILQLTGTHVFSVGDGVLSKGKYVKKLEYIEDLVEKDFLFDYEQDQMAEGMYAGLLAGLEDPYSYYYTIEDYEEELTYSEGTYVGIGIVLQENDEGGTKIVDVYKGYPGEIAGLEKGDLIVGVNGEDVRDLGLSEVASRVRGSENDTVLLTIYKEEAAEPLDIEIVLTTVEIPNVEYEMLENQVGYIHILEFTGMAHEQYCDAFEDLKNQGMERLVIDIRDNPGGYMNTVCDILEEILPDGLIVYIEDKYGNREDYNGDGNHPLEIPLAVLVNGNSASASEIFAGAVKDYGVGTIVGTTTFGKGIVQELIELDDGSAIKLTMANYFTPNGNNIHKIGIQPDVEVKLDESLLNRSEFTKDEDNQLQEAIKILKEK